MTQPTRLAVIGVPLALAAALLPNGATASAAGDDLPPAPTVRLANEFGGLTPFALFGCGFVVRFEDPTPSAPDAYGIAVDGVVSEARVFEAEAGSLGASLPCPEAGAGTYAVSVVESGTSGEATGPATAFTFRFVGAPERLTLRGVRKVDGRFVVRAGTRVRVALDGAWEPGRPISSQVWTSRTRTFGSDDFTANREGRAAILDRDGAAVTSFRIPARLAGRWMWSSFVGRSGDFGATGVADRGFVFRVPAKILPPKR